jgi:hypothetical protein
MKSYKSSEFHVEMSQLGIQNFARKKWKLCNFAWIFWLCWVSFLQSIEGLITVKISPPRSGLADTLRSRDNHRRAGRLSNAILQACRWLSDFGEIWKHFKFACSRWFKLWRLYRELWLKIVANSWMSWK